MDSFFYALKKGLVATMFVVFAFVAVYTPQLPTSQVNEVEAGAGLGNFATELTQIGNNVLLGTNVVQSTITAGATAATWVKENVLDGIGWAIAKRIVSGIIRSLIDWVNSGFAGKPAFIQDLRGFLLNIADEEIGRVISEMGEIGSFICSPFRLDAQVSVAIQYAQGRDTQQTAPTCTLSGVIDNIQGFISGLDSGNGLSDWFTITSQPMVYTPYGAALTAQATARARLINAEGDVLTEASWGDGFLSQKICRSVSGFTGSEDCSIVKPGRVIADQLNKALGAGQDALIEADEINELIAALLGQLANKAVSGVAGLLGLSGGTGFGGYTAGPSFLDNLVASSTEIVANVAGDSRGVLDDTLRAETDFRDDAQFVRDAFVDFLITATNPSDIATANLVIAEIDVKLLEADSNITDLQDLLTRYDTAAATGDDDERAQILLDYTALNTTSEAEASRELADWTETANDLGVTLN